VGTLVEGERKVQRTTEIAAGLCHMGAMGARARMSLDKSGGRTDLSRARK